MRLHNLLTPEMKHAVRVRYYTRVASVVAALGTGSVLLGVVSLVPTYVVVEGELTTIRDELAGREAGAEDRKTLEAGVAETRQLLAVFEPHLAQQDLTAYLDLLFAQQPSAVRITGIAFERGAQSLLVSGLAKTRGDLVDFVARLEQHENVEKVALPIEDLARSVDLPFSISVTFVTPE